MDKLIEFCIWYLVVIVLFAIAAGIAYVLVILDAVGIIIMGLFFFGLIAYLMMQLTE